MHCQLCGKKLALFRKSSYGDFCSAEHRVAYLTQQANLSLTRLLDMAPRVPEAFQTPPLEPEPIDLAQFEAEDSAMVGAMIGQPPSAAGFVANGLSAASLLPRVAIQSEPTFVLRKFAPATAPPPLAGIAMLPAAPIHHESSPALATVEPMMTQGLVFSSLRLQPSLPLTQLRLRQANLVLPWSAGQETNFSLESLVAAVWAKPGDTATRSARNDFRIVLPMAWPILDAEPLTTAELAEAVPAPRDPADDWEDFAEPVGDTVFTKGSASDRWEAYLRLQASRRIKDAELEPMEPPVAAQPPEPAVQASGEPMSPRLEWKAPPRLVPAVSVPASTRAVDLFEEVASARAKAKAKAGRLASPWANVNFPAIPATFALVTVAFLLLSTFAFLMIEPTRSTTGSVAFNNQVNGLRALIRSRAAVMLYDDFRSGLASWDGPAGWASDWSYDQAGFLRPGKFGILKETKDMSDYKMEFLGQIERKSVGWVFRAKDESNYLAAKITITKPGPLPAAELVHFRVTDGIAGRRYSKPLPFTVRNDTLYNVQLNVRGDEFVARVNGVLVDYWSDSTLNKGGVGFTSDVGEAARVRWLRVSDKDDLVGRVCSMIAARVATLDEAGFLRANSIPSKPEPLRFAPFVVVVPNL